MSVPLEQVRAIVAAAGYAFQFEHQSYVVFQREPGNWLEPPLVFEVRDGSVADAVVKKLRELCEEEPTG